MYVCRMRRVFSDANHCKLSFAGKLKCFKIVLNVYRLYNEILAIFASAEVSSQGVTVKYTPLDSFRNSLQR